MDTFQNNVQKLIDIGKVQSRFSAVKEIPMETLRFCLLIRMGVFKKTNDNKCLCRGGAGVYCPCCSANQCEDFSKTKTKPKKP